MKCPVCGFPGAYVGLQEIECQSRECEHYARPELEAQCKQLRDEWSIETEKIANLPQRRRSRTSRWASLVNDDDWKSP